MRWKNGYTLIEILVGLTIIGILFSVGYVSFRDFSRRQALAGVAKQIQGDIRLAQEQSLSGKKPEDPLNKCAGVNFLDGYNFKVNSTSVPASYSVEAVCAGQAVEIKSVNIPSDFSISSTIATILFKPLGQGTNIPVESATITITQDSTGNQALIVVSAAGEVE